MVPSLAQFPVPAPAERFAGQAHAHPVGAGRHLPVLGAERFQRGGVEPVVAGSGNDVQDRHAGIREVRLQFGIAHHVGGRGGAGAQQLPGGQRCGPDPGHGVRGPAAQHRFGCCPAADGQVAAEAALGRADGQDLAVEQGERGGHGHLAHLLGLVSSGAVVVGVP